MCYVGLDDFASRRGIAPQTVERWAQEGKLAGAHFGEDAWCIPADAPLPMRQDVKTFMPIWADAGERTTAEMIDAITDAEERGVAHAAMQYFRSNYWDSAREAAEYLHSDSVEIRASALLVHGMASVALGDAEFARADFLRMKKGMEVADDVQVAAMNDVLSFLISVFFHTEGEIKPFNPALLPYLPVGTRLYAMYGVAHADYLRGEFALTLGEAKAALLLAMNRYPIVCEYLAVIASVAAFNLGDTVQAGEYFHQAWSLAEREGFIQPFVEHHGLLQGQIEKYVRDHDPEAYRVLADKVMSFSRGWMKIHNPRSENKVTDQLLPHEFALAMLAARGKTNQEIADYMHISINTVKLHLSTIYQKVGVTSRKALRKHLNS